MDSPASPADLASQIDALVEGGVERRVFPGAVWAVGGPDGLTAQGAAGLLDPSDTSWPMRPDTLFDLASLTKIIAVWAAVGTLWEADRVDLDDPLAKHLPDALGFPLGTVTIRQFLTHTSGVPLRANLRASYGTDPEAVRLGVLREAVHRPAGEAVEYTDRSALILGFLVEQLMDRRLDAVARDVAWEPLGMSATRYGPLPASLAGQCAPTEFDEEAGAHVRGSVHDYSGRLLGVCGISGVFSNAVDLGRFLQHMLNPEVGVGVGAGAGAAFGRRWIRESLRLHTGDLQPERGLFWHTVPGMSTAEDVWTHYGFTGTAMWVSPVRDRWAVLLTNKLYYSRDRGPITTVRNGFRRLVFGD
ncbi:beta-lactamase family protein [Catenulispora sp. NF23]|uniref:Beta-lactamase family protein n=1 Tax=Catenulispora pinistramenti TaxID=2705254 RepID=A0ABS5L3A2_9ACTN|nr:serine hydrolase domain-containing protein [Catenulispora pinistramenti]MBS2536274.1 beta-lactamase family protein [Catenulispora pinistramenti]MBS2552715.1 beta-lactamase family protein [Catenulispora pinistramenti]